MPATVVIFSCQILRFSINLKYSASTEKSPQPGHHVGWSAASSFLVRPLRSVEGGALTTAVAADCSVKVWLIKFAGRNYLRILFFACSRISLTFQVRPSVLLTPWIFGSQ